MTDTSLTAGLAAWRDRVTPGDPASPLNRTSKAEVRGFVQANADERALDRERLTVVEQTAQTGRLSRKTWAELAALTPPADTAGEVPPSDTGTHTDPVVGGVVPNSGVYRYSTSPAGWERIADFVVQAGRTVMLFRTGTSVPDTLVADPLPEVVLSALSQADVFVISMIGSNTISTPTIDIAGLGAKPLRAPGGDPLAVPAWVDNTHLFLKYHAPSDQVRIFARGASPDDPVAVSKTDYLPVTQTNDSGNLWVVESAAGRQPAGAAENTKLALVVGYAQGEGGILIDASAIFAVELGQVVWPSGAQVSPGELPVGRLAEIRFNASGALLGKWVLESPTEPTANVQSIISYYAAGAGALYAQRILGR